MQHITYQRKLRKSKKALRDKEVIAREIIRRGFFGTTPPTILIDARKFFAENPPQRSLCDFIAYLSERYPQTECKAYTYTNICGNRLVIHNDELGGYQWNAELWAVVQKQIDHLQKIVQ